MKTTINLTSDIKRAVYAEADRLGGLSANDFLKYAVRLSQTSSLEQKSEALASRHEVVADAQLATAQH